MTDTDALTERIARAICEHDDAGGDNWDEDRAWYMDQAAAVLPTIAAEVRKAKAEALRSAADMIEDMRDSAQIAEVAAYVPGEVGRQNVIDSFDAAMEEPGDWLRSLADSGEADTYREDRVDAWLAEAWDEGWKERSRRDIYRSGPLDDARPVPGPPRSLNPYRETGGSDEHR